MNPDNPNTPIVSPPIPPPEETATEAAPPAASPGDWRVILLGIYLLLLLFAGLYVLATLMMAQTLEQAKENKTKNEQSDNTNSNNNSNSAVNAVNSNAINANGNTNANVSANANTNTNTNRPVNTNTDTANSNSTAKATTTPTVSPTVTPTPENADKPPTTVPKNIIVKIYGWEYNLTGDGYFFWVVFFSGMMGALIRCIFSYFRHLGFGDFSLNWAWFYLMLPFGGAILSLVLYFVIRGGFYSSSLGDNLSLNLFSFAALGALTGLFSENAMEKLKQVAESLLTPVEPKSSKKKDANGE